LGNSGRAGNRGKKKPRAVKAEGRENKREAAKKRIKRRCDHYLQLRWIDATPNGPGNLINRRAKLKK